MQDNELVLLLNQAGLDESKPRPLYYRVAANPKANCKLKYTELQSIIKHWVPTTSLNKIAEAFLGNDARWPT